MASRIMIVDDSPLRNSFLNQLLDDSGKVVEFRRPEDALEAINRGMPVDVAVLQYRRRATELIRALGDRQVRIIAFGSPRPAPPGVEQYLAEPVLGFEVRDKVEKICKDRARAPRPAGRTA